MLVPLLITAVVSGRVSCIKHRSLLSVHGVKLLVLEDGVKNNFGKFEIGPADGR